MARGITFSTKLAGPFFELEGQPLKDAGADVVQDILKEGVAKVQAQLYPGHGVVSGRYRSSVREVFTRRSAGSIGWGKVIGGHERNDFIKGAWLENASRRSAGTRFRGYQMYRRASTHLKRVAGEMAGRRYARAVTRLT